MATLDQSSGLAYGGPHIYSRRFRIFGDEMPHRFYLLSAFLITILAAGTTFAQECRVKTTVRVLNEHEQPVSNISAEQLKAEIGGTSAKVIAVTPATKPSVVLLIDASSSMKSMWNESISAARELAASADNGVAAVVFRDRILASTNNRQDTEKLLDELPKITPSQGGTLLYDTLVNVGEKLKGHDVALVLIGDGEDNMSHYSSDQVASAFSHSAWPPVFGLILDYGHQETRRAYFKKIAVASGGATVVPKSSSKVADAESALSAEISSPLNITLEAPRPFSKPEKLKLRANGMYIAHVAEVEGCD